MSEDLWFNGVSAVTGDYLFPSLTTSDVSAIALGDRVDPQVRSELAARDARQSGDNLGVVEGVDVEALDQAGWAVVFAPETPPGVRRALAPLLQHRKEQATRHHDRYREYELAPGESSTDFLVRNGVAPGEPADPDQMP